MSKDKGKKKKKENKEPEIDESSLSLWQRENLRYLKEKGAKPHWQDPPVTNDETQPNDEKEPEPEENEQVVKEKKQSFKEKITHKLKTGKEKRVSFTEKLPKLRDQSYKILRRRLIILIVSFSIPLLFLLYYVSPYSKLQNITVTGNQAVDTDSILQSSNIEVGENIFQEYFTRNQRIENIMENNPQISSATIQITNPISFEIVVSEYQEIAVLLRDNQYHSVLENGTVLEKTVEDISNFPVLQDFEDQTIIKETITAYHQLPEEIKPLIETIQYTPSDKNAELLTLTMADGNQVLVPYSTMVSQMGYYSQVAAQMTENGVIDMEVGIFSYPYGNEETNESSSESSDENSVDNGE